MAVLVVLIYLLICFLNAWFIGRHKKIGFWLSFLLSFFLTPFLGFLIASGSKLKNAPGCHWCGNEDNEAEHCGICFKNEHGDIKKGFEGREP